MPAMPAMPAVSTHARRRRHPVTEAGLWLLWITARVTGLGTPLAVVASWLARVPLRAAIQWLGRRGYAITTRCARAGRALLHAGHSYAHRVLIRVELAAADLLTGPAVELLDDAAARVRRRTAWLGLAGAALANLTYLVMRP